MNIKFVYNIIFCLQTNIIFYLKYINKLYLNRLNRVDSKRFPQFLE